jgi:hypothetical protein
MFGSIVQDYDVGKCSSEAIGKDIFHLNPRRKYSDSDKGTNKLFS